MKKKTMVKLALMGAGVYYLYKNRDEIKQGFESTKAEVVETKDTLEAAKKSIDNIKKNVKIILDHKETLTDMGQDLNYQFQTFNKDTQARLTEIQSVMEKYQDDTKK